MKKTAIRRLVVLTLCLTMVSLSLIGGTLAKYTTTYSGIDTLTVAKWAFSSNSGTPGTTGTTGSGFTLSLVPTGYDNVNSDTNGEMLAPGTSGSFEIKSTNPSDVDATYTISFTSQNTPTNLKFYYDANHTNDITAVSDVYNYNFTTANVTANDGKLAMNDSTGETVTIYWNWAYENSTDADHDKNDTIDGTDTTNNTMTVTVTVTGTQDRPEETTTPAA